MKSTPSQELVDVIDDAGHTISVVTRGEMRTRRLPHRCVYILVFNSRSELFVHLRTQTKDVFPGHWDVTIGGVLDSGSVTLSTSTWTSSRSSSVSIGMVLLAPWVQGVMLAPLMTARRRASLIGLAAMGGKPISGDRLDACCAAP